MRWLLVLLLLSGVAYGDPVCAVSDGDTFRLCNGVAVRIFGIDAPEKKQPFGLEARDYLSGILMKHGAEIRCKGKSYHRRVCFVRSGGLDISREMVGRGYAWDSKPYSGGAYKDAEAFARRLGRGVWSLPGAVPPWEYRRK